MGLALSTAQRGQSISMNRRARRANHTVKARAPSAETIDTALKTGLAQYSAGDRAGAVATYSKALVVAPGSVDLLMNLGRVLASLGFVSDATTHLRKAAALRPGHAGVQRDIGDALTELGLWDEALAALCRSVALDPWGFAALTILGRTLLEVGRRAEAIAALQRAVAVNPMFAVGYFELGKALYDDRDLAPAIDAFSGATLNDPDLVWARFALAATLGQSGKAKAATDLFASLHPDPAVFRGAVDSYRYIESRRTASTRFFATTREMLRFGLEQAEVDGLVIELGVRYGISMRWLAEHAPSKVHGFDSFEGLPEAWHVQPKGVYSTHGARPELPANVELHVGLFDATLPGFLATHDGPIRLANIDCDLYSSTLCALDLLGERVTRGTVLVFDEYLINDAWREDEWKAFQEVVARRGLRYEYLAFSLFTGQAVVRIL